MTLRPELPPAPGRIARLPVHRGYPVPWFVGWVDADGHAVERGEGTPDFRVLHPDALRDAVSFGYCWVCGQPLGANVAFVIGPMCAVNRVSSEPPSHVECAEWSARACPFLSRPHAQRREAGLPPGVKDAAGVMLRRNPGVAMVWVTRSFKPVATLGGVLFRVGDPERVTWWCEGRDATRAEIEASIDSGLPTLREMAEAQGPLACAQLGQQVEAARALLPA